MIQSIDQQFISSQSSSKRGKILVQPHFIVRLNFLSQIISSLSYRTYGTKPPLRQFFTKISIVHRLKMQAQILLSLLFAASVCGRPTGREIAQVSFLEKNFGKKILFGRKKTGSDRLKRIYNNFSFSGWTTKTQEKRHRLLRSRPSCTRTQIARSAEVLHTREIGRIFPLPRLPGEPKKE